MRETLLDFVARYINTCKLGKHPLDDLQIKLLEKMAENCFISNSKKTSKKNINEYMNKTTLGKVARKNDCPQPGKLYNLVTEFRDEKYPDRADLPVTNSDALELYKIVDKDLHLDFPVLKKLNRLPKKTGWDSYKLLHFYLSCRKLIPESKKLSNLPETF